MNRALKIWTNLRDIRQISQVPTTNSFKDLTERTLGQATLAYPPGALCSINCIYHLVNVSLKKDIRNEPSKASISNHIYCTLICDLQLLSTKLHCFFVSWVGHLNTIFIPRWDSCNVVKKTWEMPKKCAGTGAMGMLKIDCAITRISIYSQSFSA